MGVGHRANVIYLAIIAVLLLVAVVACARAARAARVAREVEEHFGLADKGPVASRREPLRTLEAAALLRPRGYAELRGEMDALVARAAALGDFGDPATRLGEACRAALAGGKRLRSVVTLEVARRASELRAAGAGGFATDAADAALVIEELHAASLVLDDLPHFDDDAVRRGRPAVHAAYGVATAQLAAAALVAAAFQTICRQVDWIREHAPEVGNPDRLATRLLAEASHAMGAGGAAGGQYMDCLAPAELAREFGAPDGGAPVLAVLYRKTATFFEYAAAAGWLVGGGDPAGLAAARAAGRHYGLAFQIADDLADAAQDAARRARGKPGWNLVNELGAPAAVAELERNLAACEDRLRGLDLWTPLWRDELFALVGQMARAPPGGAEAPVATGAEAPGEASAGDPQGPGAGPTAPSVPAGGRATASGPA